MTESETKTKIKSVFDAVDNGEYKRPDQSLHLADRIMHFILWAGQNYPYEFVPVRLIYKAVMGVTRMPSENAAELNIFNARSGEVRRLLGKRCQKGLLVQNRRWRVTVDDLDYTKTQHQGRIRRLSFASRSFRDSTAMINLDNIPAAEREIREQVRASKSLARMLSGARIEETFKLLPPKATEITRRLAKRNAAR